MNFDIVLACDSTYGIGKIDPNTTSTIPWGIAEDMKFFRELTKDVSVINNEKKLTNAVIMGRITADTLPKPLPNRLNIVITSKDIYRDGFIVFKTLDDALNNLFKRDDIHRVFVIGGAVLANQAIVHKKCRGVYLNMFEFDYQCNVKLSFEFITNLNNMKCKSNDKKLVLCKTLDSNINMTLYRYLYINHEEDAYLNMLNEILEQGDYRETRNAKTYSVFGKRLEFDLKNGFPLITTKKMFYRGIIEELLFFLRGDTDTKKLEDKKVMIWHDNVSKEFIEKNNKNLEEYDMGPMYGFQWRHFGAPYEGCHQRYDGKGFDQLKNVIDLIVKDPHSRRILMTTYNPTQAEEGVLYPCHGLAIQFYVEKNNRLSLQMYQR